MPPEGGYPGVYVEEVPGGTIDGVPTSICAFVGRAARGPIDTPVVVTSFADFQRRFGGGGCCRCCSDGPRDGWRRFQSASPFRHRDLRDEAEPAPHAFRRGWRRA